MEERTNNMKKAWKKGQKHLILPWKNGQAYDNTKNRLVH